MITFRSILQELITVANLQQQIISFHSGFIDEVDINKLSTKDYPILYAEPNNAIVDTGVMTYTFTLYILDQINDEVGDYPIYGYSANLSNTPSRQRLGRIDALSENLNILKDVINAFKQSLSPQSDVDGQIILNTPITIEPFTARFNNLLTGWSASIELEVNNTNDLCISPFN